MQRLTITIPRCYNDGRMVPVEVLDQIDTRITDLFGGYSRVYTFGQWSDGDTIYADESFRYEILTGLGGYEKLVDYARRLCSILDQKCILTTCEDVRVDFVTG